MYLLSQIFRIQFITLVACALSLFSLIEAEDIPEMPNESVLEEAEQPRSVSGLVRTLSVLGPLAQWIDLKGNSVLVQSLSLTGVHAGDLIKLRSEFGVTNNVATRKPLKGSEEYKGENRYDVKVTGSLKLSSDQNADSGRDAVVVSEKVSIRNHHGLVVISGETMAQEGDEYLNLVASAKIPGAPAPEKGYTRDSKSAEKLPGKEPLVEVEDGDFKVKVDALVLSPGWENSYDLRELSSDASHILESKVKRNKPALVISFPLGALRAGDVLDVEALMEATAESEESNQLFSNAISISADARAPGKRVSVKHGYNIPPGKTEQVRKVAAFTADRDYANAWIHVDVNTMSSTGPKGFLKIDKGSKVKVQIYSQK